MAIALVSGQNVSASGTYNATSVHFNNTVGSGNTILIGVATNDSLNTGASSVYDSGGSTYARQGTVYLGNGLVVELWATFNAVSTGSPNQTVTCYSYQTGDAIAFIAQEFTGFSGTTGHFDTQTGVTGSSTTSNTTPNINTNNASEILIGLGSQGSSTNRPYTAGSGYTMINQLGGTVGLAMEYQIISTQGSYNANMTIDLAESWDLALFALSSSAIAAPGRVAKQMQPIKQSIKRASIF